MTDIPLSLLFLALLILIVISAFFSGSETSMMAINRYRLKHLKEKNHKAASRVDALLERTDFLLSVILLGNNFVNILASSIATVIGIRLFGDTGIAISTGVLTFVILVFAEITPKTIAVSHPEKIAFPAARILTIIVYLLSPFVWGLNFFTKNILRIFCIKPNQPQEKLDKEELRSALVDSKKRITDSHYQMLIGIMDLEKLTVEDIMVPQHEIMGIDLNESASQIIDKIRRSKHTRLPVYKGRMNDCIGMIHIKDILQLLHQEYVSKEQIITHIREPLFVLANSLLDEQLRHLQQQKKRTALVVNEYGELQGLITLDDILEEIVGNFTTNVDDDTDEEIHPQSDGTHLINGTILLRELNEKLNLNLPIHLGAKTLNGLILNELGSIPEVGTSIKINGVMMEIISTMDTSVDTVKVSTNLIQ